MPFWIWLILGFVLLSFLGMFAATWPIAKKVYHNILVRTGPEKWTRANSMSSALYKALSYTPIH